MYCKFLCVFCKLIVFLTSETPESVASTSSYICHCSTCGLGASRRNASRSSIMSCSSSNECFASLIFSSWKVIIAKLKLRRSRIRACAWIDDSNRVKNITQAHVYSLWKSLETLAKFAHEQSYTVAWIFYCSHLGASTTQKDSVPKTVIFPAETAECNLIDTVMSFSYKLTLN